MVVVADGSDDEGLAVAQRAAQGNPSIHAASQDANQGYGGALNPGILAVRQDWILYADGDAHY